jgi:hypothetical protein
MAIGLYLDGGIGYRTGEFNWNIGSTDEEIDVVSELRWKGLKAIDYYAEGRIAYFTGKSLGFELHYSPIFSGSVTDSDFFLSGKRGEYSHTVSSANKGYLIDLTLKSDNTFPILGNFLMVNLTGGYCYHRQHLSIIDGKQTISLNPSQIGPIKGLNNRYTTLWSGAYIGGDLICGMAYPIVATAGYRYEYMSYHAKGRWNSRDDFIGPFSHHSNQAWANLYYAKLAYYFLPCVCLIAHAEWQFFVANNGTDETTVQEAKGPVLYKSRLNHVGWNSQLYLLHLAIDF